MALGIYAGVAITHASNLVVVAGGASVEVKREDTNTLATIFSDRAGTLALANPFVADAKGRFEFYAAPLPMGYKVTVSYSPPSVLLAEPGAPEVVALAAGDPVTYALRYQQVQLDASAFGMTVLDDASAVASRTTLDAQEDLTTTKGDLVVGGASGAPVRKAAGANASALVADSTQADGLAWNATALPAIAAAADANAIAYAIALG